MDSIKSPIFCFWAKATQPKSATYSRISFLIWLQRYIKKRIQANNSIKNRLSHDNRFQKTNYLKTNLLKQIKKISFPFTAAKLLCFVFSTKNFFLKIVMLRYKIPKKRDGFQLPPLYLLCSLSKITSCRPYLEHRPLA